MIFPKLKNKKIKIFFQRLPRVLAEKAFLTFLGLFFAALILAGFVFYKYSISAKRVEPKITDQQAVFPEEMRSSVLKFWEEREKRFEAAGSQNFSNPFE